MKTRIAMVVFSYYPADPRPRREAEALVAEGMPVDMICLKDSSEPKREIVNGVNVYRLPLKRKRGGKLRYIWEYVCFVMMSFFILSMLFMYKRYSVIHVHNMPDFLVFSALLPRLTGSKVILDLHDPMSEVYMTKYSMNASHPVIQFLLVLEKYSIRFASIVLTPNIAFRDLFISRGCPKEKIHIVMNSPDEAIFCLRDANVEKSYTSGHKEFVLMYHGTIVERNGLDVSLYAISRLLRKIPNIVFHVYGDGDYVDEFLSRVNKMKLSDTVVFHGCVPLELIPQKISMCDLGLIPNKRTVFTEVNLPTRIFEYLCMGKPVIAPRTRGILDYFDEKSMHFHEPGNAEDLAEVIFDVYRSPKECDEILERGIAIYRSHRWESQRQHFLKLEKKLLSIHAY